MAESYRLVYRGEVLEGQHPAVVRKRLTVALKLREDLLEKLFSGQPVVLKRSVTQAEAARFQALFKQAGARLRVQPLETQPAEAEQAPADPGPAAPTAGSGGPLSLAPPGAPVLRPEETQAPKPVAIDTSHLKLQGARFGVAEPESATGPERDLSHLSLAATGTRLSDAPPPAAVVAAPGFELADVGERLGPKRPAPAPLPAAAPDLELADPGTALGPVSEPVTREIDLSHLALLDLDAPD